MEEKKTIRANLEQDRTTFLLMGFVVALATLFVAFEWENHESLSPDWVGFSPLFIEQETTGVQEVSREPDLPKRREVVEEKQVEEVSEEFNIVDETSTEEIVVEPVKKEPESVSPPSSEDSENPIYTEVEIMPQFKGGYVELVRFIYTNLAYPSIALTKRIQGKIWCSFIVNTDGTVSDVRIEQSISFFLEEEALRVLKIMPDWEPGRMGGKPVQVKIYLPIVFKL
jgi:protein TonB